MYPLVFHQAEPYIPCPHICLYNVHDLLVLHGASSMSTPSPGAGWYWDEINILSSIWRVPLTSSPASNTQIMTSMEPCLSVRACSRKWSNSWNVALFTDHIGTTLWPHVQVCHGTATEFSSTLMYAVRQQYKISIFDKHVNYEYHVHRYFIMFQSATDKQNVGFI